MKRILFVEDDRSLLQGLSFALKKQGYALTAARTREEGERLWAEGDYDLVLLDVALPDGSGLELCRKIRRTSRVPVMFLTAADEETDIIMGLDIGGDDYITKPFKLAVFLRLLRQEVTRDGEPLELTASEYKLLCLFMQNPDIVLSPEQILGRLWDCDGNYIDNSTLTVYIRRLRKKIEEDPGAPRRIVTVRGMGYKWSTAGGGRQ